MKSRTKVIVPILSRGLITLALSWLGCGCSTFNRDWNSMAAHTNPTNDIAGRWEGTWLSEVNGHTDKLRCLMARQADGSYQARFHAKYRKIFSFAYTVPLQVEPAAGLFKFQGEADLGWYAGGLYHYYGQA